MKLKLHYLIFLVALLLSSCLKEADGIKLFPIKAGDKWGYVDNKGEYVINSQFEEAYNFSEGLALFKSTDGKFGFISEDGKYAINPIYKYASSFSEGLACVVIENGKPQYIDQNNKIIFTADNAEYCNAFKEGLASVKIKGKWGFVDKTGKVVVNPIYEKVEDFKEGLAAVAKKDEEKNEITWGYIDKSGAVKINFQFTSEEDQPFLHPGSFSEGLAFVSSDGKQWGCIDKEGKYQINPQFDGEFWNPFGFKNGVSIVTQGGSYGFINSEGKYVINPQFKNAKQFSSNGLAAVQNSDGKWGFVDQEGKYEINPQFENVAFGFFGDVAFVKSSDKYGIIDKKGLYIVNPQFDDVNLFDIGNNLGVKTDYVDNEGIAEIIFEKSSNTKYLAYDKNTTLGDIIDDYPKVDISDLKAYNLNIETPKIFNNDMMELGSLYLGFDEKTFTETPIYKTVRKYSYYGYYNDKEFVRMDKKIQNSSPLTFASIDITLKSLGKGKGRNLAEAIKDQASAKMKVTEVNDLDVENTDYKGMYVLTNENLLVYINYLQSEEDDASLPTIVITVVFDNFDQTFEELEDKFVKIFNE